MLASDHFEFDDGEPEELGCEFPRDEWVAEIGSDKDISRNVHIEWDRARTISNTV